MLGLGCLVRGMATARPNAACLGLVDLCRVLEKSTVQIQAGYFSGKDAGHGRGWVRELSGSGSQGITRAGQPVLAKLMKT